MTAQVDWSLSPTDSPAVAALRYLPAAFFGGYIVLGAALFVVVLPGLLTSPRVLAVVLLLALVGGPLSLLYLWPMLRDPDQRPNPGDFAWFADLRPARLVLAALVGSVVVAGTLARLGRLAQLALVVCCLFVSVVVVSFFESDGSVDPHVGTLTYRDHTVDTALVSGVWTLPLGSVRLFVLRYHARVGGGWKPRVFVVPERVAGNVEGALRRGAAETPETEVRTPDRVAQAVLVAVGLAFVVTAVAIATVNAAPAGIRGYVAFVSAVLGLVFLLGAYYVA